MADDVATMARIIRRYSNRKLYDTEDSHYVTLAQVAAIIRAGDDIQVLSKDTGADLTAATMALILFEEEKRSPRLPVEALRRIIRNGLPM
jgi:polyhydroxyalkanoate synthesis repressor PhaR